MSADEAWVSLLGWGIAALTWWRWYSPLLARSRSGLASNRDFFPWMVPVAGHAVVLLVLETLAADDVRDAPSYILMYLGLGSAWMGTLQTLTIWIGISGRDDAVERTNPAAALAITGALLGLGLCYAGGNVGNGPGWWVVVFCATLATAAWSGAWWIVEAATGVSERVTVDRDLATGLRLAAFLASCGLLLGRAVAGDWVSLVRTLRDFAVFAWPVAGLVLAEILVAKLDPQTALLRGLLPALVYLAAAFCLVASWGPW